MTEEKKYHCRVCGDEISEEDYIMYEGRCFSCAIEEEDDDMILGGRW
jgi:DNA-directed RNA polymerase subunit RPC12/RpoP